MGTGRRGPGEDTPSTEWGAPETEMKREGFPMDWSSLWEDSSARVPATSADNPPQNPPPQVGRAFLGNAAQRWGSSQGLTVLSGGWGSPRRLHPGPYQAPSHLLTATESEVRPWVLGQGAFIVPRDGCPGQLMVQGSILEPVPPTGRSLGARETLMWGR